MTTAVTERQLTAATRVMLEQVLRLEDGKLRAIVDGTVVS